MKAIRVEFTDLVRAGNRSLEWPPHPGRLFSAGVAAVHDGQGNEEERSVLLAWEKASPPAMHVPRIGRRDTPTVYVPSNMRNDKAIRSSCPPLPQKTFLRRLRSGRKFPAGKPDGPVYYQIPDDLEIDFDVFSGLLGRIPYLGTTASVCTIALTNDVPEYNLIPLGPSDGSRKSQAVRVPYFGYLASLERCFEANSQSLASKGVRMHKPRVQWWQYAATSQEAARQGEFEELIPLRLSGPGIGLRQGPELCKLFRRAVIDCVADPVPEVISGHTEDGNVSQRSHIGFMPLAFVGDTHADGHVMGIGILLPRGISHSDRFALLRGLAKLKTLNTAIGQYDVDQFPEAWSLRANRYTRSSRKWVTVTPIELPTFPRKKLLPSALIASACEHSGLPRPAHVHVTQYGQLKGCPGARDYPRERCPLYHAKLTFDSPVEGPVSLGRGRYLGHGLCLPC